MNQFNWLSIMAYLLDDKKNLGKSVIPVGSDEIVTVYREFQVQPEGVSEPFISIDDDGSIVIGAPNIDNNLQINSGICYHYEELTGTDTSYTINSNDYFIEVVSSTYMTIQLPSATGNAGCSYIISRCPTNTNNKLTIMAEVGETIDGKNKCRVRHPGTHTKLISNGKGTWYSLN